VSPYHSKQAGPNAILFVLRMAHGTLGKCVLALGSVTRLCKITGYSHSEPDRNNSYQ